MIVKWNIFVLTNYNLICYSSHCHSSRTRVWLMHCLGGLNLADNMQHGILQHRNMSLSKRNAAFDIPLHSAMLTWYMMMCLRKNGLAEKEKRGQKVDGYWYGMSVMMCMCHVITKFHANMFLQSVVYHAVTTWYFACKNFVINNFSGLACNNLHSVTLLHIF